MCGIIAVTGKDPVHAIKTQYSKQKSRGSDGFGFIAIKDNRIVRYERTMRHGEIEKALKKVRHADTVIFHHRYPTSTVNVPEAAHPIRLASKRWDNVYYIVHNGVIHETSRHESAIEKAGYRFTTRIEHVTRYHAGSNTYTGKTQYEINDSEILGYYVAEYLEGIRKDIPVGGAIACIVVKVDKRGNATVYAMRNGGNPLIAERSKDRLVIASEAKGAGLESHTLYRLTANMKIEPVRELKVGTSYPKYEPTMGYSLGKFYTPISSPKVEPSEEAVIASEANKARIAEEKLLRDLEDAEMLSKVASDPEEREMWRVRADKLRDEWYAMAVSSTYSF